MIEQNFYSERLNNYNKKSKYFLLIDGDLLAYPVAAATDGKYYGIINNIFKTAKESNLYIKTSDWLSKEDRYEFYEPEETTHVLHSLKLLTESIIQAFDNSPFQIYLSGDNNFRYNVCADYKSHRKLARTPHHLSLCREYLVDIYGAVIANNEEADDRLGIEQYKIRKQNKNITPVVCSLDKDLNMIDGWHYKWPFRGTASKLYYVSPIEAYRNFYKQLIVGDKTDNIEGLSEKAPKRRTFSIKPLDNMQTAQEMEDYVFEGYAMKYCDEKAFEQMTIMGRLLWIRRKENELWRLNDTR